MKELKGDRAVEGPGQRSVWASFMFLEESVSHWGQTSVSALWEVTVTTGLRACGSSSWVGTGEWPRGDFCLPFTWVRLGEQLKGCPKVRCPDTSSFFKV